MQTQETQKTQRISIVSTIQNFIQRYVWLPDRETGLVLALWVIHSWNIKAARATPYIYINSPEKQSGKSKLIEVLSLLVRNPLLGTSMTGPVLFRALSSFDQPTLLLDELDTQFAGAKNEEMRCVLNSGYREGGHVWRVVKGEPAKFKVFAAKLLAGIDNGKLPDTIADRCIAIKMRRKPRGEAVEPFYYHDVLGSEELEGILNRLDRWSRSFGDELSMSRPVPIEGISDRKWEISEPLVAIAEKLGIGDEAREAIKHVILKAEQHEGLSEREEFLLALKEVFTDRDKIATAELVERLDGIDNGRALGVMLRPYGVQPKQIRIGNWNGKGYVRADFDNIWDSYL